LRMSELPVTAMMVTLADARQQVATWTFVKSG
jgi:hypothetical protein